MYAAAAAPAYAVSGDLFFTSNGACKYPGNSCNNHPKGYAFYFLVTSTFACASSVSVTNITWSGAKCPTATLPTPAPVISVPSGTSSFPLTAYAEMSNSAQTNCTYTLTFSYTDCHNNTYTKSQSIYIPSTPPDCVCTA